MAVGAAADTAQVATEGRECGALPRQAAHRAGFRAVQEAAVVSLPCIVAQLAREGCGSQTSASMSAVVAPRPGGRLLSVAGPALASSCHRLFRPEWSECPASVLVLARLYAPNRGEYGGRVFEYRW